MSVSNLKNDIDILEIKNRKLVRELEKVKISDNKEERKKKKKEAKETIEMEVQCDSAPLLKFNQVCESLGKERKNSEALRLQIR